MLPISLGADRPLSLRDQALLFHHCAQFLKSGLPLGIGLVHVREHASARMAKMLSAIEAAISRGNVSLAQAFAHHFPGGDPFVVAMIEQGEASGRLDEAFVELEATVKKRIARRNQLIRDLAYPAFLVVIFLLLWPVPKLFNQSVEVYLACVVPPFLVLGALLFVAVQVLPRVRLADDLAYQLHRSLLFFPFLGRLTRAFAQARFGRALGLLLRSGIPMDRALDLAASAAGNRYVRLRLLPVLDSIRSGQPLSKAMAPLADVFSTTFVAMVATGEASGDLDRTLLNVADLFEQEAQTALETIMKIVGPLINVIVLLSLAGYVISFYWGYFDSLGKVLQ